jgi:hypothetical protein
VTPHLLSLALPQGPEDLPPGVLEVVKIFFTSVVLISLGIPIIRAFVRRFERGPQLPPPPSPDVTARLERIENAIEAVAIEVERIAEAQRFSAKLMADQQRNLPRSDTAS